jgi:hypothetical protein
MNNVQKFYINGQWCEPVGQSTLAVINPNSEQECARKVLREKVLPSIPAEHKHAVLMVLNTMSIAERQLHYGQEPERRELAALSDLLGEPFDKLDPANRSLAIALRNGEGDPGQLRRAAMLAQLRVTGRQRVLESNPKALPGSDACPESSRDTSQ